MPVYSYKRLANNLLGITSCDFDARSLCFTMLPSIYYAVKQPHKQWPGSVL